MKMKMKIIIIIKIIEEEKERQAEYETWHVGLDRLGPLSNGRKKGMRKREKRVPKKLKRERGGGVGEGEKCKNWMDVE
jgi:predicted GTPase